MLLTWKLNLSFFFLLFIPFHFLKFYVIIIILIVRLAGKCNSYGTWGFVCDTLLPLNIWNPRKKLSEITVYQENNNQYLLFGSPKIDLLIINHFLFKLLTCTLFKHTEITFQILFSMKYQNCIMVHFWQFKRRNLKKKRKKTIKLYYNVIWIKYLR